MIKKMVFLVLFCLFTLPSTASSYGTYYSNQFSTGETSKNLTFNSTQKSDLFYLSVPRRTNITHFSFTFEAISTNYSFPSINASNMEVFLNTWAPGFDPSYMLDDSYDTYSYGNSPIAWIYLNWTAVPANATDAVLNVTTGSGAARISFEWSLKQAGCFQRPKIVIAVGSLEGAIDEGYINCYNGSSGGYTKWKVLRSGVGSTLDEFAWLHLSFNETAVLTNITMDIGNDGSKEYSNNSITNETLNIVFNSTQLSAFNNYLRYTCISDWAIGTCDVPFNVTSETTGILKISAMNLTGGYTWGLYDILIYDEMTGTYFNTSDMTLTALCDETVETVSLKNYSYTGLQINCSLQHLKLEIVNGANVHWRTLILEPSFNTTTIRFFMINETKDTARLQNYKVYDVTGQYYGGTTTTTKAIPNFGRVNIIEQDIDAENKVTLYLVDGETYTIAVINDAGTSMRSIGNILADAVTTKNLVISSVPFISEQSLTYKDIQIYFEWNVEGNYLRAVYNDTTGATTNVTFIVRNASNISQIIYWDTGKPSSPVVFTFTDAVGDVLKAGSAYILDLIGIHPTHGVVEEQKTFGRGGGMKIAELAPLGQNIWMSIAAGLICVFVMLSFGKHFAKAGILVSILMIAMFMYWGWFDATPQVGWGLMTLLIFVAFANMMGLKKGDEA